MASQGVGHSRFPKWVADGFCPRWRNVSSKTSGSVSRLEAKSKKPFDTAMDGDEGRGTGDEGRGTRDVGRVTRDEGRVTWDGWRRTMQLKERAPERVMAAGALHFLIRSK